ncbi:MAG: hypothetical protein F4071_04190 [Acidimicrobiaceae bacterium]|nr:hypothetical protein [Acidimicrobiaceae bacterium]
MTRRDKEIFSELGDCPTAPSRPVLRDKPRTSGPHGGYTPPLTCAFCLEFASSGWAVLATGALVASLLAVGASSAVALDEDSKPNAQAATSACVGDATGDMMFSDVSEMHAFRGAIDCLAYYGITVGYGDGTFRPEADVSNEEMVLFMERAAGAAGADAEAVVGDFAMSGSDPVHRGDMALLIARLLVAATTKESPVNVTNNADGTFAVSTVMDKDWDFFADSRRSQNRVHDSAASALYELGVAQGTGMGYFSPGASVNRGQMAAFITRALAHTSARPEGVTIQTDEPGGVIISVRDANFHPVANAPVDIFSARADQADEAFSADGSCNMARVTAVAGNAARCEIDALDAITGLDGNNDPGAIDVNTDAGGTTVWAWTGESGDKVEDGGEGIASVNLTATAPVGADAAKVTTDVPMGVTRQAFGSTVTVTIQLVGDAESDRADAGPTDDGDSYTVTLRSMADLNEATDDPATAGAEVTAGTSVSTQTIAVDASGKGTFTITAADPDPNNDDDPDSGSIDRVRVSYTVAAAGTSTALATDITGSSATGTITFSDAPGQVVAASLKPTVSYLTAPTSGAASNVVTVTVVDQYGKPVRGHLVRLSSNHSSTPPADADVSKFPRARRTDSSGTVRIGYSHTGNGSIEALVANTSTTADDGTETLAAITGGTANFYWAKAATTATEITGLGTSTVVHVADADSNTLLIGGGPSAPPLIVRYDDNDQYSVGASGSEELTSMAAFEEALAKDEDNNDTVAVTSYDPTDSSDVARFVLTVVADT